jgi:hypothetical protein
MKLYIIHSESEVSYLKESILEKVIEPVVIMNKLAGESFETTMSTAFEKLINKSASR